MHANIHNAGTTLEHHGPPVGSPVGSGGLRWANPRQHLGTEPDLGANRPFRGHPRANIHDAGPTLAPTGPSEGHPRAKIPRNS